MDACLAFARETHSDMGGANWQNMWGTKLGRVFQQSSVAFCSPAKSLTFSGVMGKPISWQKVKVLTSKQDAPKKGSANIANNYPFPYRLLWDKFTVTDCLMAAH